MWSKAVTQFYCFLLRIFMAVLTSRLHHAKGTSGPDQGPFAPHSFSLPMNVREALPEMGVGDFL